MSDAYYRYIRSDNWARNPARLEELRLSGYRCRLCGVTGRLTVHHRTYRRLGREWPADLTTLCFACHRATTDMLQRRRFSRRRRPEARDVRHLITRHLTDSTTERLGW